MHYQGKKGSKAVSIPVTAGLGVLLAWSITILVTIIVASLIAGEHIPEGALAPIAVGTVSVSAFIAAAVAARKMEQKRMITCVIIGAVYYVSLLCCTALFFEGRYQGILGAALTILGSSAIVGLLRNSQKGNGVRRYKMRYKA